MYAMVKNKNLDSSHLIFYQIGASISWKKRHYYVPYPHWLSLVLAHIVVGYIGGANDTTSKTIISSELINISPSPQDPPISQSIA